MATTVTTEQVRQWLAVAPKMLEELQEQADRWEEMPDWEQVDWSLEWEQFAGYLKNVLDPAYRNGSMTPAQLARYRDVLGRIKAAIPLLRRLNLTVPAVALDSAA